MKTIFSIFITALWLVALSTIANADSTALPTPEVGSPGSKVIINKNSNKSISGSLNVADPKKTQQPGLTGPR